MKKILNSLFGLSVLGLLGLSTFGLVNAQNTYGTTFGDSSAAGNIGVAGAGVDQGDKLVTSVKTFINRVLGILALITLVILLRGGFQMVTAAGDDTKYKSGFKILKQAGFGLAFIGLAWLIVSMIFRVIGLVTA
ncbi:hypothetical protein K9M48_01075 [Candidatus Gracilibacteria bacterium]|nr:hypothetical protein [Candidatus Gracilibacteria bacterium]